MTIPYLAEQAFLNLTILYLDSYQDVLMEFKEAATASINRQRVHLAQLSEQIWENPELGFKEKKAHCLLTDFLEREGFKVERSFGGLETAFRASFGSGGRPNVCVICEYDALPDIGHACGHNLIAEAGVAAGVGVKAALEHSASAPSISGGGLGGTITVMGTPAEETLGGKINLIQAGAFADIDIAMMVHPSPYDIVSPTFLAVSMWAVTFTGKASHAAAFPWEGINALDAAVVAYNSISVLRQQMKPSWRVHGVALNGGGEDPAIIPSSTKLLYYIRTPDKEELVELEERVMACFRAAALATGCTVEIKLHTPKFDDLLSNDPLASCYANNLRALGKSFETAKELSISTDFGNVSHLVPSIHPMYQIGNGEVNHTEEFAALSNTPRSHQETLTVAKAMAHTCIEVLTTDGLLERIKIAHSNK